MSKHVRATFERTEVFDLLEHVVRRQSVTSRYRGGGASGFGSRPPLDLGALEARDRLRHAYGREFLDAEEAALRLIERPATMPLGECPCGAQLFADFDRVATQCRACGVWHSVADSLAAAREYTETTWLTPVEIEHETRGWSSPVKAHRVRLWKSRGQIVANADGRYLLADVLRMIDHQAAAA